MLSTIIVLAVILIACYGQRVPRPQGQASRDALKEKLLSDYRMKLLQQQEDLQRQETRDALLQQKKSLDQTKEELKRSLLKDFCKELMLEEHEREEFSKKRDASVNDDFDDEVLRHLGRKKLFYSFLVGVVP